MFGIIDVSYWIPVGSLLLLFLMFYMLYIFKTIFKGKLVAIFIRT